MDGLQLNGWMRINLTSGKSIVFWDGYFNIMGIMIMLIVSVCLRDLLWFICQPIDKVGSST